MGVGTTRVSTTQGFQLNAGDFRNVTQNLPQQIIVIGEANNDKQSNLDVSRVRINNLQEAADKYGEGSPLYHVFRILHPNSGQGVQGIPTYAIAQVADNSAVSNVGTITVTGNATASATHFIEIAGRTILDGLTYAVNIASGDTPTIIAGKIRDAIQAVSACPVSATVAAGVVTYTNKWAGLTGNNISIVMRTGDEDAGVTYAVANTTPGAGTPDIAPGILNFGDDHTTLVINTYGTAADPVAKLTAYNGKPDNTSPTGLFNPIDFRPLIAVTGSVADEETAFGTAQKNEVTIAIASAPRSNAFQFEAAANMVALYAPVAQDTPHLDIIDQAYPDMPIPFDSNIGPMKDYVNRDTYVKSGASTVTLRNGRYIIKDFVTTYHPDGENPPQHRYVRNRTVDSNIAFTILQAQDRLVIGKTIIGNMDVTSVTGTIKPNEWKAQLVRIAEELTNRGLISDTQFTIDSITVQIATNNADRFDSRLSYKRSGVVRIGDIEAEAGFNFATL